MQQKTTPKDLWRRAKAVIWYCRGNHKSIDTKIPPRWNEPNLLEKISREEPSELFFRGEPWCETTARDPTQFLNLVSWKRKEFGKRFWGNRRDIGWGHSTGKILCFEWDERGKRDHSREILKDYPLDHRKMDPGTKRKSFWQYGSTLYIVIII